MLQCKRILADSRTNRRREVHNLDSRTHRTNRRLMRLLFERKARLEKLILAANANWLHYSESFDDGLELLKAADRMRLEGIVSKRRDAPYRSGKQSEWIKVKRQTWREANKERWRLFSAVHDVDQGCRVLVVVIEPW